jgi:hypothetical protein
MGCINRDENAVNNMIKIVNQYLQNKDRPEKFKRSYKFLDEIKDDNPKKVPCSAPLAGRVQLYFFC